MRPPVREAMLIVLVLLLFPMHGSTQTGPRKVHGTVVDHRGNLLPKSVVQLENTVTLEIQSYVVQSDGEFHFKELSPNVDFRLHAAYRGTSSKTLTLSRLDSERDSPIKLMIPVE